MAALMPWPRRRVGFIPQMEAAECGAAALAMVLAYHGHHAALPEVRQACGIARDGASALDLVLAARGYGLEARGYRAEPEQLARVPLPAILHWDFEHFVVLERLGRAGASVVDPACGRRRVDRAELGRRFTGAVLAFGPTAALRPRPRRRPSLARYGAVFRANLPALAQVLLAALGLELAGLVFPVANQLLLDRVVAPRQEPWLWGLLLALGAAALGSALLGLVRGRVVLGLQARLQFSLAGSFLGHLLGLPLGFFLQRDSGELVQRARASTALQDLLGPQAAGLLLDLFLLAGYAALLLAYDPRLGALIIAISLVEAGVMALLWDRGRQLAAAGLAARGREAAAQLEALAGLETLKANGSETRMVQRWAHRMTERVNRTLDQERLTLGAGAVLAGCQGLAGLLVFWLGGSEVLAQRMTLGSFAAILALQGLLLGPLGALTGVLGQLQLLGVQLGRLDDVLETPPEAGPREPAPVARLQGGITLEEVSFGYIPGGRPVLAGLSLSVRPGEKLALVGPSGSGKSTLARLLLGLHLPDRGRIRFDGIDLRDLDPGWVRRQLGVVLQETFLFDDTVRANLALNDDGLPLERLRAAARLACVDQVVEALPDGYFSRTGENGCRFSGGQRQRLSLARALAHGPAILLLDEATSSLDLATEARIHANLAGLGCTRILIAHRLATVMDADRILVLEGGRIAQEGGFDTLMRVPGPFRRLLDGFRGGPGA